MGAEMDNFTAGVLATITSDRAMSERALEIARKTPRPNDSYSFQIAETIGNAICIDIGERLSRRFDGAVPKDEIHDCLWMTFMSSVNWTEIGRYYLEDVDESTA